MASGQNTGDFPIFKVKINKILWEKIWKPNTCGTFNASDPMESHIHAKKGWEEDDQEQMDFKCIMGHKNREALNLHEVKILATKLEDQIIAQEEGKKQHRPTVRQDVNLVSLRLIEQLQKRKLKLNSDRSVRPGIHVP